MMSNLWSYEPPTEPGWYWVNNGDAVTADRLSCEHFMRGLTPSSLYDAEGLDPADYSSGFKFLKVDINALNELGNE